MFKLTKIILMGMLASALLLGPMLAGCSRSSDAAQASDEGYQVGNLAPDFGLHSTAGETVFLHQFRGRPVLINFWATWCPPCRAEMPLIQAVYDDKALADKGLVILGIDLGEDPATVQTFLKGNGLSFPVLLDTEQFVAREYNIGSIPTTYFIDKDGIIRDIRIGAFANKSQIIMGLNKIIP